VIIKQKHGQQKVFLRMSRWSCRRPTTNNPGEYQDGHSLGCSSSAPKTLDRTKASGRFKAASICLGGCFNSVERVQKRCAACPVSPPTPTDVRSSYPAPTGKARPNDGRALSVTVSAAEVTLGDENCGPSDRDTLYAITGDGRRDREL